MTILYEYLMNRKMKRKYSSGELSACNGEKQQEFRMTARPSNNTNTPRTFYCVFNSTYGLMARDFRIIGCAFLDSIGIRRMSLELAESCR